jgi:hypothetical protein
LVRQLVHQLAQLMVRQLVNQLAQLMVRQLVHQLVHQSVRVQLVWLMARRRVCEWACGGACCVLLLIGLK